MIQTSPEHTDTNEPIIEHVAYGDETGINPVVFSGVEHIPYTAMMSTGKIHVYFTPRSLSADERTSEALKQRAISKIDPRITYRRKDNHSTFNGFLITPEYLGGKFSQPAFDWLMEYCNQIDAPIEDTTSINKPTIALFLQKQNTSYGFTPDSMDAIAEILPPKELGEFTRIRWLYNVLPPEERKRQVKQYTFYEVVGENGIIEKRRRVLGLGHHVVAMHTPYSRK
jgi:hypothetical protein